MKKEGEKESERRRRIEKEMPLKGMRRGKTTSSFLNGSVGGLVEGWRWG